MPATVPARTPPLSPDAIYWRGEAQKAIKEREDIKKSLVASDGPAAFWRDQAKDASKKLADAQQRVDGLRKGEREQRENAIKFSEEVDALKRQVGTVKQRLWEVWGALDETSPMKQALWEALGTL